MQFEIRNRRQKEDDNIGTVQVYLVHILPHDTHAILHTGEQRPRPRPQHAGRVNLDSDPLRIKQTRSSNHDASVPATQVNDAFTRFYIGKEKDPAHGYAIGRLPQGIEAEVPPNPSNGQHRQRDANTNNHLEREADTAFVNRTVSDHFGEPNDVVNIKE